MKASYGGQGVTEALVKQAPRRLITNSHQHDLSDINDGLSPLHHQVTAAIRRQIESGELSSGSMLPPEIALARQLGVSRHTMRAGLDALVREGLLVRQRGKGTIVARPRIQQSLSRFYSLAHEMRARGEQLTMQVLARGRLSAADDLAHFAISALHMEHAEDIGYVLRLRVLNGEPLMLETLTFQAKRYPWLLSGPLAGEDPAAQPFYDELVRRGEASVTHARETFQPVAATGYEARLLQVPPGTPVFQVDRTSYADDVVIEWRRTLVRGDRYVYAVDLNNPVEAGLSE